MNLFVGNVPFDTAESELRSHFEQFGKVLEVSIKLDRNKMPSIAFVEFKRQQDARRAIEQLNGVAFGGRALTVAPARRQ